MSEAVSPLDAPPATAEFSESSPLLGHDLNDTPHGVGVVVRGLCRGYGTVQVIDNLSLTVPRNSIYGLLGPSGCGKTTLLKVLLGRLAPDDGRVLVLGQAPHSPGHSIPGIGVGYMPQEIALWKDLSVDETLQHFARLNHLRPAVFEARVAMLSAMLELPPGERLVRVLSGGQQRRLSLAAALLHKPKLLILDEPTVGVDPLLRERVWDYLRDLVANSDTTVIITTHYIEEARHAHCVGMMRHGRLLIEGAPNAILRKFSLESLEEVFLRLCKSVPAFSSTPDADIMILKESENATESVPSDEENESSNGNGSEVKQRSRNSAPKAADPAQSNLRKFDSQSENLFPDSQKAKSEELGMLASFFWRTLAIMRRRLTQVWRNKVLLLFELLMPALEILLFLIAIGAPPTHLQFAVVNDDRGVFGMSLGDMYIQQLTNHSATFDLIHASSWPHAVNLVREGSAFGAMYIPENFTLLMESRFRPPVNASVINQTTIGIRLDMTNYQIAITIEAALTEALNNLGTALFHAPLSPLRLDKPVYGSLSEQFSDFLAPGVISVVGWSLAIGTTSLAFVLEKHDGMLDRSFAAGVPAAATILGHFATYWIITVLQTVIMLLVAVFGFDMTVQGNMFFVFTLLVLLGTGGMSMGLLISSFSDAESTAVMLSISVFFPIFMLSGILWPLNAIPIWFRWVSYGLPTTWSAMALRDIITKGWGFFHESVWMAFLVSFIWTLALVTLASTQLSSVSSQWRCCPRKRKSKTGEKSTSINEDSSDNYQSITV